MSHQNGNDPGKRLAKLPAPPVWNADYLSQNHIDHAGTIRARIAAIYQSLCSPSFVNCVSSVSGGNERVSHLKSQLEKLDQDLTQVPTIGVALLGPSRHGKSTLLNALAQCDILPMSDIKPCTASIVSLRRAEEWGFELRFIDQRRLLKERKQAVADAHHYLDRVSKKIEASEVVDDPQYIYTILQRFIQLFKIDTNLPPAVILHSIEQAEIPSQIQRLLGQLAKPRSANVTEMKDTVEKFLSTKDIYWTIVDSCEISGPFEDWHPNLKLVDVPGTNDTDPHRTDITNRLRKTARAVAICTSDSNLGPDIQSWLRNSSVLTDYLESSEQSKQHLFILRTKFDSYHAQIDEALIDENDEEAEDRLMQEAIATHKRKQTDSYREMFRNIATPFLPIGVSQEERQKREEMVARINGINVFYVSALAHEVFAGRSKAAPKAKRRLSEHFQDDPEATGIPSLKRFVNQLADEYLKRFFFQDIETRLRTEVDLLVRFFRQQWTTLTAELSGGSNAIADLVKSIEQGIIPSLKRNIDSEVNSFRKASHSVSSQINRQLKATQSNLREKLRSRQETWRILHWNSLRAAARKNGVHVTYSGIHIDFNNDISALFVDDVSLSWTTYRDSIIQDGIEHWVEDISSKLQEEIDAAASDADTPEATEAIDAIASNLSTIARSHRDQLKREVSEAIRELESIRQPAYESVQKIMCPVYQSLAIEVGAGCQKRMLDKLVQGSETELAKMWTQVATMIESTVTKLGDTVLERLQNFGSSASMELRNAVSMLTEVGKVNHRERLMAELDSIRNSALIFWDSLKSSSRTIVYLPSNTGVPRQEEQDIVDVEFEAKSKKLSNTQSIDSRSDFVQEAEERANVVTPNDSHVPNRESAYAWLLDSPVYLVQKSNAGRVTPEESQVLLILETLKSNGYRMTAVALGENAGLPVFRLRGVIASLQRILNMDGQKILNLDRPSDTIEFNDRLLRQEFLSS